jgi:sugar/nucleoside kinase (ribokinase family)
MLGRVNDNAERTGTPAFDVVLQGTVFFDLVLTGLPALPSRGTESWAEGMGSCPGGIANLAIAASRLGLQTSLSAAFGDDVYGDFLWRTLAEQEGVDLSRSRRFPNWHSPVTVSMAVARDRAMVTHAHPPPRSLDETAPPQARAGVVHLDEPEPPQWLDTARRHGTLLFADVGWDPSETWSADLLDRLAPFHAFLPNSVEAMAYTRTDDPRAALLRLADMVPVAVVTCGGQGSLAVDSTTGEEEWVPSLPVNAVDATGAGDVFAAAFVLGTLRDWPLRHRLAFANLCAALSVQQVGGSLAAPGWGDIADWLGAVRSEAHDGFVAAVAWLEAYSFLLDALPREPIRAVRRASATIARTSDA